MSDSPIYELEELAPSPVSSDDMTFSSSFEKIDAPPSSSSATASTSTTSSSSTFLGLRRHNYPSILHAAQRYSSYAFSVFAAMHITNTSLLPLITQSVPESSRYLLLTRPYYQSWPVAEPLLVVLPLFIHIASGLALRLYHRRISIKHAGAESRSERRSLRWPRVSTISALGFASVPLVLGHAALTRGLPLAVEGGSSSVGLDFVGHGVALHPVLGVAGYFVLVAVAASHMVLGTAKWLGWLPEQVPATQRGIDGKLIRKRRWWVVNGTLLAVVSCWIAGGVGVVARAGKVHGWVGRGYNKLLQHIPLLGRWV